VSIPDNEERSGVAQEVRPRVNRFQVPLSSPSIVQDDINAVMAVMNTPTLSLGPQLAGFEQAVADYVGSPHAVAVNSGTSGLHISLAALHVGPGDEVITSPFSFVASANCALYQGARPVFADIDQDTLNIDPGEIERVVTPNTRAILPVDVFGQPVELERIVDIARARDLAIVQDSCEAIGAERNHQMIGASPEVASAVFAFYPNKQMTTGEGGIVVTHDAEMARVLRSLTNQGRDDAGTWMNHVRLGFNYRLDEMSAALGRSQVRRLDAILDRRAQVAAWYGERLRDIEGVRVPFISPETTRMSWFVYVIRLHESIDRDRLILDLEAEGVPSRPYFVPIHLQPYYRDTFGYGTGDYPVTERVARTTLAIPFFTDMREDQVEYVVSAIAGRIG
jgi:perosamine synthetase